ncbi:MAG: hypothetical protein L6R40_007207 [Gallowayella cf. fulva]|nr:MAG: hypothetical protein L6R40_007207 [Xanthomendoza cf. fulva]
MAIISARNAYPSILSFCFASGLKERSFNCNDDIVTAANDAAAIPIFAVLLDEGGLDVNHYLESYRDMLNAAVYSGNIELVKYLFSKGADPSSDRCSAHGDDIAVTSAISGDSDRGGTEMLRVLFEYRARIEETGALIRAAEVGNLEAIKLIFEMKSDEVDFGGRDGRGDDGSSKAE